MFILYTNIKFGKIHHKQHKHTPQQPLLLDKHSKKIFKPQKTMAENVSWLQGNHEQSPFTERLCLKSRCLFSISLQTMIGSILYFISCWAKYYLKILMNLTKSFIRDKENCGQIQRLKNFDIPNLSNNTVGILEPKIFIASYAVMQKNRSYDILLIF